MTFHVIYMVHMIINSMINQCLKTFLKKVFCQVTNGLAFESEIWETVNSMISLVYNHYWLFLEKNSFSFSQNYTTYSYTVKLLRLELFLKRT